MSSSSRKRPKPKPNSSSSSHSPSISSLNSIMEPPQSFFPSKGELLRLVAMLTIATSVAVACNLLATFLNTTSPKPFCDSNLDTPDSFSDSCEPCPSNGECYQGKLECVHGYRKQGKLCVEDGDINETAKKLSEWVENRLCEANAQLMCDGTGTVWVQEDDIWNYLDEHKLMENFGHGDAIYLYTRRRAMENIVSLLETRTDSHGIKELKCPDILAEHYKPFTCRICQWMSKQALIILPVCALLVGCTLLISRVRRSRYLSTRIEELYCQVCEILEENALTSKSLNGESEPWVVASRLRDHLLLPRERKDPVLWKKVAELVQEDSRVDQYPKLVKGESKVVWEWQVEGSLSSSRMRKKEEASKLRSNEGMDMNVDKQPYMLKAEPRAIVF